MKKLLGHDKRTFFVFTLHSAISFAMNTLLLLGFHELIGFDERTSFAVAVIIIFVFNLYILRRIVFRSTREAIYTQFTKFLVVSLFFRFAEVIAFSAVYQWFGGPYVVTAWLVLGVSAMAKFLVYKTFVFSQKVAG